MRDSAREYLREMVARQPDLHAVRESLGEAHDQIADVMARGGTLFVCGNGGSAADAEHIVGELAKGFLLPRALPPEEVERIRRCCPDRDATLLGRGLQGGLRAVSLASHVCLATAIANDTSAELVFAQQLYALGATSDALLGISTSGNARNVLLAVAVAKAKGMVTLGLTGSDGGELGRSVDTVLAVPATETARIQEFHVPVYHTLCAMLEATFFG